MFFRLLPFNAVPLHELMATVLSPAEMSDPGRACCAVLIPTVMKGMRQVIASGKMNDLFEEVRPPAASDALRALIKLTLNQTAP